MDPVRDPAVAFRYHVGQRATLTRTFCAADVADYLALIDATRNPREVPLPLIAALISCLLGTRLPGRGTNWLKQQLTPLRPAVLDEPLHASVEIVRVRPEKQLVNLRTICADTAGQLICDGEALVLAKEMP